jgi:hypothetical protein
MNAKNKYRTKEKTLEQPLHLQFCVYVRSENESSTCVHSYGVFPEFPQAKYEFLFESPFICKLYRYCKITRGMKRSAQ